MAKLFFSYCHVDEAMRDRLEVHLSLMKHQGLIETWHDRRIPAGDNVDSTIDANLESSDIVLLLVSADFIASKYCFSIEMKRALERQVEGSARVIPVILDDCDWHSAPFGKLLAVPKDGKAVTAWPNQAQAWADAARQIRKAIDETGQLSAAVAMSADGSDQGSNSAAQGTDSHAPRALFDSGSVQPPQEAPRSSNLRLKKEFSDFDRDRFLHETFDFMAKFFDASLVELAARNEGVQARFQRVDAQCFSGVAYRAGKSVAECSVRIGGFGGRSTTLSFSYNANAPVGTSNEMLTVESDSQAMFFKSMGMQSYGREQNSQLSEQGASEYFWGLFIRPLQG